TDFNVIPFNGPGRLRYTVPEPPPAPGAPLPPGVKPGLKVKGAFNNFNMVNYQYYPTAPIAGGFLRDPEIYGSRLGPSAPLGAYVGGNVPWTYPDLNNMFLAPVDGNGRVLMPSFHRPWNGPIDPQDPRKRVIFDQDAWKKYLTLRPHPSYHPQFVPLEGDEPDVKNLEWGPGLYISSGPNAGNYANNDSYWMDLGFPVL